MAIVLKKTKAVKIRKSTFKKNLQGGSGGTLQSQANSSRKTLGGGLHSSKRLLLLL